MKNTDVGFYFKKINDEMIKRMNPYLKKYDLHFSQAEVLRYLLKNKEEKVTLQQIMNHFNLQHPTVIGIMQRLEKKDFIISYNDEEDKRVRLYKLTDKAYEFKTTLKNNKMKMEKTFRQALTNEEIIQLKGLLDKLYAYLVEGGNEG